MPEDPLKTFESLDPKFLKLVRQTEDFVLADGALPSKYKILIGMCVDAINGETEGVTALAGFAMKAGAKKEEVAEALRAAYFFSGVSCVYTAAAALNKIA